MSHWYIQNCFFVVQVFGYRFEVIDRKRNPVLSSRQFPVYQPKEFRIGKYSISLTRT